MPPTPTLFCPRCQTYLGSHARACSCGWERQEHEHLPEPGQPLWNARLEGAVHGALVVGDLVIFHYGDRNARGGVCAFDRVTGKRAWSFETPHSVEGGVVYFEGYLYFATCGFLGGGAELYCLRVEDGGQRWKQQIGAGVWSKPVVEDARLYVAQEDGTLRGFDNRQGAPISHGPVSLPRGKVWLERVDQAILALSKSGQVLSLNPQGLFSSWNKPYEIGCEITSAPCRVGRRLFFGGRDGQVIVLDTQTRKHSILASGLKNIVAAPACSKEGLFVGAHDHYLHAFDLGSGRELWKSREFEHSITPAPFAADGFVVVCINQDGVALLDAQTGELAWHFPVGKDVRLLSDPVLADGVIYAGTDTGQVFALPWHLGKYEWAGHKCRAREECEQAGMFFVLCAQNAVIPEKRENYYQLAEECWKSVGRMDLAGRFWEHLIEEKRAADAYRQAGQQWIGRDNQQAADYYSRASLLYWQLDDDLSSRDCARKAQKLVQGPLLRIKPWTTPRLTQYKKGQVTFRVENIGNKPAEKMNLNVGGSLVDPVTCQVLTPLSAGDEYYFDITLTLTPTKSENDLIVQVEYYAANTSRMYRTTTQVVIEAEESPIEVNLKDVVAMRGIELNITDPQKCRVIYNIDSVVASEFRIGSEPAPRPAKITKCPHCNASVPSKAKHCDKCGRKL